MYYAFGALAAVALPAAIWYVKQVVSCKIAYRRYKKLRARMA